MKKSKESNQSNQSVSKDSLSALQNKEGNTSSDSKINRKYKDSLFIHLFSNKESIIDLYNAIEGTSYTYDTDINIITLEDVIEKDRINDLCFTIDDKFVVLVEHQSTINENMPLRFLIYVAREYDKLLKNSEDNIYGRALIKIPTPEFIVLYNGRDKLSKTTLQLSDAFKVQQEKPLLNLTTEVINIKYDENIAFVNKCKMLRDYSFLIYRMEKYQKDGYTLDEATEKAISECIEKGILSDYLKKNKSEVYSMLTSEWKLEKALEVSKKEGKQEGFQEGIQKGIQKGIQEGLQKGIQEGIENLISSCKELGISYEATTQKVIEKYSLEETQAKDMMKNYWK